MYQITTAQIHKHQYRYQKSSVQRHIHTTSMLPMPEPATKQSTEDVDDSIGHWIIDRAVNVTSLDRLRNYGIRETVGISQFDFQNL